MFSTQQSGEQVWEALKSQVERLGQLDGYPKPEYQPKAFIELVIALQNADSLQDAKQFIDDLMMCELVCPKPSQIRNMILDARDQKKSYAENPVDPFEALKAMQASATPSERENLAAHLRIMEARMKETKGMTWPQRLKYTPLREALQIADRQLVSGLRVTGAYE